MQDSLLKKKRNLSRQALLPTFRFNTWTWNRTHVVWWHTSPKMKIYKPKECTLCCESYAIMNGAHLSVCKKFDKAKRSKNLSTLYWDVGDWWSSVLAKAQEYFCHAVCRVELTYLNNICTLTAHHRQNLSNWRRLAGISERILLGVAVKRSYLTAVVATGCIYKNNIVIMKIKLQAL